MMTENMTIKLAIIAVSMVLGIVFISGCSSMEPVEYQDEAEEMPGPGLFTGEDGEAVLFRIPDDSQAPPEDAQAADTTQEAPESERMIQTDDAPVDATQKAPESERMIQP